MKAPGADPRALLLDLYHHGLKAVEGGVVTRNWLADHPQPESLALVALGKAAAEMARGALEALGDRVAEGLAVTKRGHGRGLLAPWSQVRLLEADHPEPGEASLAAGRALLDFVRRQPSDRKLLFLISGGTSALVEWPESGLGLEDVRRISRWLLGSGLDIAAMNAVRRRFSALKGGKLLDHIGERPVEVLLISDVRHDDPAVIAAGLLHPLAEPPALPPLPEWLEALLPPAAPSTRPPPPHHLVATLDQALDAIAERARRWGLSVHHVPDYLSGDAAAAGRAWVERMRAGPPGLWLQGGETTVVLPPKPGRGGRNQHLALAAALAMQPGESLWVLAAGSDGSDGPTEDAGALVDAASCERIRAAGQDPAEALARADAGSALAASGDLVRTGPTGTNVCDLLLGWKASAAPA